MAISSLRWRNKYCVACITVYFAAVMTSTLAQTRPVMPPLAVLAATIDERKSVERELQDVHEERRAGILFLTGKLRGRPVVVAATGVGKVNAAACTMLLLLEYKPSAVLMTGTAGAINPQLEVGTVVIAQRVAQHDVGTLRDNEFSSWAVKNPADDVRNPLFIPAARELLLAAKDAAAVQDHCVMGVIVSGDIFVSSAAKKEDLRRLFRADAVDMESAAAAQICWQHGVPFLAIRGISDPAAARAGSSYDAGRSIASDKAAEVTCRVIEHLSQR
jgi:adenosylhomocysteine nucleosidase